MTDHLDKGVLDELHDLRKAQDIIDEKIIEAIAERVAMRRKISALRIKNDLPTVDADRMQEVLAHAEASARDKNIPVEMIHELFSVLIDWSHRLDMEWREGSSAI